MTWRNIALYICWIALLVACTVLVFMLLEG